MDNTFLIADPHYYHKNIIDYCNRPFSCVEEMNEVMVQNWNKTVGKYDKGFILGDFALCGKDKIIEIGQRLNGKKTLILGNHDRASTKTYYEAGFDCVVKYPILYNDFFLLSHEPKFQAADATWANIYGHVHGDPKYLDCTKESFCVSAERINYTPISFEEIYERMSKCGE